MTQIWNSFIVTVASALLFRTFQFSAAVALAGMIDSFNMRYLRGSSIPKVTYLHTSYLFTYIFVCLLGYR